MVGPRAPIGSLANHLGSISDWLPGRSAKPKPPPKFKSKDLVDESEDESSATSESDSDSDVNDEKGTQSFLDKINGKQAKAKATKTKDETRSPAGPKETVKEMARKAAPAKKAAEVAPKAKKAKEPMESSESSSDSSSEAESNSGAKKANGVAKEQEAVSETTSSGGSDGDADQGAKVTAQKKNQASSESSSSSESDGDDESSENEKKKKMKKKALAKTKKQAKRSPSPVKRSKAAAAESPSETSSSSESEEEASKPTKQNAQKPAKAASTSSSEDSSSDEEMQDQPLEVVKQTKATPQLAQRAEVPEFIAPDFQLRRAEKDIDASDVARIFNDAKLEGKQVWYFTVPASVPISVVEQLDIPTEKAQKGLPILSHNNDEYGLNFEDALTSRSIKLLIPNKAGDKYAMLDRAVDQTIHLKRVTQLSQGDATASSSNRPAIDAPKPARPQPKNLKARFQPIGVSDAMGIIGSPPGADSDVDMADAADKPAETSKASKKSKKRKLAAEDDAQSTSGAAASSKQPKKAKTAAAAAATPSSQPSKMTPILPPAPPGSSQPVPASTKKAKKAAAATLTASQPAPQTSDVPVPEAFKVSSQGDVPQETPSKKGRKKTKKDKDVLATPVTAPSQVRKETPIPTPILPPRFGPSKP